MQLCHGFVVSIVLMAFFYSGQVSSQIIYVDKQDLSCDNQSGLPYCQITPALKSAMKGDVIRVSKGHYFESLVIDKDVKIMGNDQLDTIIDASRKSSVVTVSSGVRAKLYSLTLQNGQAKNGGGIMNNGALMLNRVRVIDNIAELSGGGIFNARSISGSLYISKSIIEHNKSLGDDRTNIKFGGGGIFNSAPLIVEDSKIQFNQAVDSGGGMYSIFSGRHKFSVGEVVAEKLGIKADITRMRTLKRKVDLGAVVIKRSQISFNHADAGGGINVHGVLNVSQSIISENTATNGSRSSGGGIFAHFDTSLNLVNVLINFNKASFRGGGIRFYTVGFGKFNHVSIIDNQVIGKYGQGGGIFIIRGKDTLKLKNSLLARNTIYPYVESDCYGSFESIGVNYFSSVKNCVGINLNHDIYESLEGVDYLYQWSEQLNRYKSHRLGKYINQVSMDLCVDDKNRPLHKDVYGNMRQMNLDNSDRKICDIGAIEFQ